MLPVSRLMPDPVSAMQMRTPRSPVRQSVPGLTRIVIWPPFSMDSIAFPMRFTKTWRNSPAKHSSSGASSVSNSTLTWAVRNFSLNRARTDCTIWMTLAEVGKKTGGEIAVLVRRFLKHGPVPLLHFSRKASRFEVGRPLGRKIRLRTVPKGR